MTEQFATPGIGESRNDCEIIGHVRYVYELNGIYVVERADGAPVRSGLWVVTCGDDMVLDCRGQVIEVSDLYFTVDYSGEGLILREDEVLLMRESSG